MSRASAQGSDQIGFTVDLPLPPATLSSNARGHWTKRAKATKVYREACYVLIHQAKPKGWKPCAVSLDVEYVAFRGCGGYHPKDVQNAVSSIKAAIDGMADAGVMPSDAKKWLTWGEFDLITTARKAKGRAGVFLRVRAL